MAEPDGQILDYGRPTEGRQPSRPVDDWILLLISTVLLFGPLAVLAIYAAVAVPGAAILLALVGLLAWAVGSATMVVVTKRRLHPVRLREDRPNRIILAFAFSCLSLFTFLVTAGWGVEQIGHMANQMGCHENLRSIGQALLLYANDNKGYPPPDLVTLVRAKVLGEQTLQVLRCPEAPTPKPIVVTPATTDWDLIAAGATAYVYLGDASVKLSSIRNASSVPIVIELPGNHAKGLVLFADGHNEARPPQDVAMILSEHLAQRRAPATQPMLPSTRQAISENGPAQESQE